MRKLIVALVVLSSLVGASAMALTLAKTRSWAAQTIPNGNNVLPANGLNMPAKPVIAPAKIGCGWNADRFAGPDLGRLRVVNPSGAFTSDIVLNFYTDQ